MGDRYAYGVDLAADGTETLAQAEVRPDGSMHFTIVQIQPDREEGMK